MLGFCFRSLACFLSAELYCLDFARQTIGLFQCQSPFFFFALAGFGFGQLPGHCLFSEFSFGFFLGPQSSFFFCALAGGFLLGQLKSSFGFRAFAGLFLLRALASCFFNTPPGFFRAALSLFQREGQAFRSLLGSSAGRLFPNAMLGFCFRSLTSFRGATLRRFNFMR